MSSDNSSTQIGDENHKLMSLFQTSNFSSDMKMTNPKECFRLVALICNSIEKGDATLVGVNETAQSLIRAEK